MLRLTDAIVKNAGIGEYHDAQRPGLIFIVRASTSKAKPKAKRRIWTYRFTVGGKRSKMGLGAYPAVELAEARRKAREAASMVANCIDPRLARRADSENLTFRDAAEAYLLEALPRYPSAKSKRNLELALRVHCAPLASRAVLDIGTRDLASLLKAIATDRPAMAEKVRAALRSIYHRCREPARAYVAAFRATLRQSQRPFLQNTLVNRVLTSTSFARQ